MHRRERKDGEKERCTGTITPAKLLCEWLYMFVFVGRADFGFFVRFENTASCVFVLHIKLFFLCTRRHPAHPVSALILHLREIQALWSHKYDTDRQLRCTR